MPNLSAADGIILLLYFFFVGGIGFSLRSYIKSASDFLQAGRAMPAWIGGLAFIGISLGGQELVTMGALGARYGLESAQFYGIGAIPAMLFVGLFMMPLYYGSKARSVPEFLRLRFDAKTRTLYACAFAAMTLFSAGIALYAMARIIEAMHVFDALFYARGWPGSAIFPVAVALPALLALAIVWLGGLTGALYSQVMQFCLIVAGLLPAVLLGLRNSGGWSRLKAILPGAMHEWRGIGHGGAGSMGIGAIGLCLGLGVALAGSSWCVDFRVLQSAFAAKDVEAARRIPLIAAGAMVFLPLLVALPGLLAVSLPTPHTTTVVHMENGSIVHDINVVSPAVEAGKGIVPAKANAVTGQPVVDAAGHAILDFDMATPNLLLRYLPAGLLGLGIAALLAGLVSGVAAYVTAFNTVFTRDLYEACAGSRIPEETRERHLLGVARWATVGAVLVAAGAAFAALRFGDFAGALALAFAFVNAPIFATFLLGMFWKRATGHGAFAGLVAGIAAAAVHHGLTLPAGARTGLHGGWIGVLYSYPSDVAQGLWTAIFAFGASLIVTVLVSLMTEPRPEGELAGLVYSLTPRPERTQKIWWKRPEALAAAILVAAIALNLFLA